MAYDNMIKYFNLVNDGDSATVRLLHSDTSTIERVSLHTINVGDKKKSVKCCGDGCPLCANGAKAFDRIFVHLYNYNTNEEMIWSRTPTIISAFDNVLSSMRAFVANGKLSDCVVTITRRGKDFPKYDVVIQPMNGYAPVDEKLIDNKLAYRYFLYRSSDELNEFLRTGVMPEHKKSTFIPKDEYIKMKKAEESKNTNTTNNAINNNTNVVTDNSDPFSDPFLTPVRV